MPKIPVSITALALFTLTGYAQPVRSGRIPVDVTRLLLQDSGDVLNITLNQVDGMDWMVGIKVRAGAESAISVGDGTRSLGFQKITGLPEATAGINPHASDRIKISGSSVAISGGAGNQVLVVYAELSQSRAVIVRDSRGLSNFAYVKDGIVIDNGIVLKTSLAGQGELVQLTMLGLNAIRGAFGLAPVGALGPAK